jgi:hypothetical protein
VQPPSVIIAANPYEAELCRRALVETGLQVLMADGGEAALERVREIKPIVLVVALGIFHCDPIELVSMARVSDPALTIFLIGDREGDVPDEAAAARIGATRLFLRPIDIDALADAIEKRAVEAEIHDELSEAIEEFSVRPPTIDASPLVEESIVEIEADYEHMTPQPVARIALRRVPREPTQVLRGNGPFEAPVEPPPLPDAADSPDSPDSIAQQQADIAAFVGALAGETEAVAARIEESRLAKLRAAEARAASSDEEKPRLTTPAEPPASLDVQVASAPGAAEPLLRADVDLHALVAAPDFVSRRSEPRRAPEPTAAAEPARSGEVARINDLRGAAVPERAGYEERSSFARRLENELSAAERRLFPDSPSTVGARPDDYEDALGDIDLDALGIDTIPGIGGELIDSVFDLRPRTNGHAEPAPSLPRRNGTTEPYAQRLDAVVPAAQLPALPDPLAAQLRPRATLPDDEGDLAVEDVAQLVARLYGAGFTGALTLGRGDGDKTLFFDDGQPVGARSTFAHDRLVDLLVRDGAISRDAAAKLRDLPDGGRRAALALVERGLVKSSELFATLRRHGEQILYSCFAWERGRYRLGREQPSSEDRVRMGAHPHALILEGVRRKYSLERLSERFARVGGPDAVPAPTVLLMRTLEDCAPTPGERAVAELIDGERTLGDLVRAPTGAPLSEAAVYALVWVLAAAGALDLDGGELTDDAEAAALAAIRPASTLVLASGSGADRRGRPRPIERARDRDTDRAIDRERVLAKRQQVQDGDYFSVLGLDRDATAHEVARAFERLKREFAPDRFAEPVRQELAAALTEIGDVLDEAHRVLADEGVRKSYREHLPPA